MIVKCTECHASYSVDDAKVENKKFGFSCPKCGENVIIDNRKKEPDETVEAVAGDIFEETLEEHAADDHASHEGFPEPSESETEPEERTEQPEMTPDDFGDLVMDEPAIETESLHVDGEPSLEHPAPESVEESSDDFGDLIIGESSVDTETAESELSLEIPSAENEETLTDMPSELEGFDLESLEDIDDTTPEAVIPPQDEIISASSDEDISFDIPDNADVQPPINEIDSISEETLSISSEHEEPDTVEEESLRVDFSEADLPDEKALDDLDNFDITDDDFKPLEEDISGDTLPDVSPTTEPAPEPENITSISDDTAIADSSPVEDITSDRDINFTPDSEDEADLDESITIDLDSLDIQLDESPSETSQIVEPETDSSHAIDDTELSFDSETGFDAETISVSEPEDISAATEYEDIDLPSIEEEPAVSSSDIDNDLTLDLDSLDITLDEIEEFKEGEQVDEDERLTIEDAGLTIDELETVQSEMASETAPAASQEDEEEEEDLKLSIDEIDPDLRVEDLAPDIVEDDSSSVEEESTLIVETMPEEHLPEIDFDMLEAEPSMQHDASGEFEELAPSLDIPAAAVASMSHEVSPEDDFLDIENHEQHEPFYEEHETLAEHSSDTVPDGIINFSVDYSLKYSRLGAVLRLLGIYHLSLIPHCIVLLVYAMLSNIVGVFNWLIVLFTGQQVEDFSGVQEKTLRYMLATNACMTNTVEDAPRFSGSKDIDHSLQLNVILPSKPSKVMAFLRLTGVGIVIVALPHIILFTLLTLGCSIIALAGIISVIVMGRWPNILFDFMVRYYRYAANVLAFMVGLIDKYPSFRFE